MGKKKHRRDWPEAKKLCRLNQNDIAMAKSLGFGPDSLVRNRPDPKQKWKLPVKYWDPRAALQALWLRPGRKAGALTGTATHHA